jgi:hypothetical protein
VLTQFLNTDLGQLDLVQEWKELQSYCLATSDILPHLERIQTPAAQDMTVGWHGAITTMQAGVVCLVEKRLVSELLSE